LSDGKTYSLAKLVDGKIGRFLNKKVQKTEKKRGIFDKVEDFFASNYLFSDRFFL
jgi:hypothetical protein